MSSLTSAGLSMRACQAAATEWNCLSAQSNLNSGNKDLYEKTRYQETQETPELVSTPTHFPLCSWICRVVNGSMRIM